MTAALVAVLLAGVPVGCGGDDGSDGGVASIDENAAEEASDGDDEGGGGRGRPDSAEFEDALLEYAQCMRDHGVDMPDPEFSDDGGVRITRSDAGVVDGERSDEAAEAEEACQPLMDEAVPDVEIDPERQAEQQDRMVAMAECMRGRGYDMPDPEVNSNGGVMSRLPEGGDPDDPEFQDDMQECGDEAGLDGIAGGPASGASEDEDR